MVGIGVNKMKKLMIIELSGMIILMFEIMICCDVFWNSVNIDCCIMINIVEILYNF